ncbi:MAG: YciI family protein [Chitinophagaceae bacterium]
MRTLFITLSMLSIGFSLYAQAGKTTYNKALADSLGADEYGMKMYVFVILKSGTAKVDKATSDSLFGGHMQNINRLAQAGKLVVAGPFGKNDKDFRGLFILNAKTTEEAQQLLNTDPAIKAHLLEPELVPWYGSAALPMYLPYHEKVAKTSF